MLALVAVHGLLQSPASARAVDWSAGSVSATAVAPADLRLPSVEIARVAAERAAGALAASRLREAVKALPLAAGGTLAKAIEADAQLGSGLDALLGAVQPEIDYQSDGSAVARVTLPLARVAELVLAEPAAPADAPLTALVVDARKVKISPAVGYRVEAGKVTRAAPVYFVAAADDPRAKAPRLETRATAVKKGIVSLALDEQALAEPRALIVIILSAEGAR